MTNNIVDLNKVKHDRYVEQQLDKIGLDEEQVQEYDKDLFKEDITDTLTEYFSKREEVTKKLDDWTSENFKTMEDMTIFLSVVTELMQNLIVPDMEHFMDLMSNFNKESDLEFEHWINVQGELQKFHLSSMKEFVVGKFIDK